MRFLATLVIVFAALPAAALASSGQYLRIGDSVTTHPVSTSHASPPMPGNGEWQPAAWPELTFRDPIWLRAVVDIPPHFLTATNR